MIGRAICCSALLLVECVPTTVLSRVLFAMARQRNLEAYTVAKVRCICRHPAAIDARERPT